MQDFWKLVCLLHSWTSNHEFTSWMKEKKKKKKKYAAFRDRQFDDQLSQGALELSGGMVHVEPLECCGGPKPKVKLEMCDS